MKVGVLGVLATATIAAPLAAAAAGIDEAAPQGESVALPQAAAVAPQAAPAPVALPTADVASAGVETRAEAAVADRSEERDAATTETSGTEDAAPEEAAAEEAAAPAEGTGIEVSVPEPVEEATVAEPVGDSGYLRPVSGPITSGYGGRVHPVLGYFKGHNGVDFGAACGTPVAAAKSGTVIAVEYNGASGKRVKIDHGNGVITGYYHLQGYNTSVGASVAAGDTIGYVGSTGRSTGCHLHFAKQDEAGNYSNPMSILR